MYAAHFGLTQDPFSIAPDPHYLFMSERHREALAHLLFGLQGGSPLARSGGNSASGGFVLLSGEIGTGKTTVCRCFLEQIPSGCNVAYIFNPKLTVLELLATVCEEFHIAVAANASTAKDHIDPLNAFLLRTHAAGQNNVLIIDEAQNLSADVLEQLRLLTNLETNERKLLQIILIGQPELRAMLARPELEQLAQRVVARFHLQALNLSETEAYIAHRLGVAGRSGALPFDKSALKRIHQLSHGVPRRINLLCGRALLGAYAMGHSNVDSAVVNKAAAEVFESEKLTVTRTWSGMSQTARYLGSAMVGALLVGALGMAWWSRQPRQTTTPAPANTAISMDSQGTLLSPTSKASGAGRGQDSAQSQPNLAKADLSLPQPPADLLAAIKLAPPTAATAWRDLVSLWSPTQEKSNDNPCNPQSAQTLPCFAASKASLALLTQLARPAILTLRGDATGQAHAILLGLDEERATLQLSGGRYTVPVTTLQALWNGDYATLWRAPPGYGGDLVDGKGGPTVEWLALRLTLLAGQPLVAPGKAKETVFSPKLKQQLRNFQRAQALPIDGKAGPLTLMQLNRATGVDEPRLTAP